MELISLDLERKRRDQEIGKRFLTKREHLKNRRLKILTEIQMYNRDVGRFKNEFSVLEDEDGVDFIAINGKD